MVYPIDESNGFYLEMTKKNMPPIYSEFQLEVARGFMGDDVFKDINSEVFETMVVLAGNEDMYARVISHAIVAELNDRVHTKPEELGDDARERVELLLQIAAMKVASTAQKMGLRMRDATIVGSAMIRAIDNVVEADLKRGAGHGL